MCQRRLRCQRRQASSASPAALASFHTRSHWLIWASRNGSSRATTMPATG